MIHRGYLISIIVFAALASCSCQSPMMETPSSVTQPVVSDTLPTAVIKPLNSGPTTRISPIESTPTAIIASNALVIMNDDGTGMFYFGMSQSEFRQQISESGWTCQPSSCLFVQGDVRVKRITTTFNFRNDGKLSIVSVYGEAVQSERGFKVGDTRNLMRKMYGNEYDSHYIQSGYETFSYKLSNSVEFVVQFEEKNQSCMSWALSWNY